MPYLAAARSVQPGTASEIPTKYNCMAMGNRDWLFGADNVTSDWLAVQQSRCTEITLSAYSNTTTSRFALCLPSNNVNCYFQTLVVRTKKRARGAVPLGSPHHLLNHASVSAAAEQWQRAAHGRNEQARPPRWQEPRQTPPHRRL